MRREKVIVPNETFTSALKSTEIDAHNIDRLVFGLQFLQNGASAPTLATLIPSFNDIKITVGGEVVTLVRSDDLYVLNKILGIHPFELLPGGDNEIGHLLNLHVPLELTTDKTVKVSCSDNTPATIDTETLTVVARYRDKAYNHRPLCLQYITQNTAIAWKEFDFANAGKVLLGLLIYNTTIPTTSARDITIAELKLLVNRDEKLHTSYQAMDFPPFNAEETTGLGVADNYRWLDLRDDPVPADKLKIAVKSLASATDAFRALGMYR